MVAEADVPSGLGPVINEHPPKVIVVDLTPAQGEATEIISTMRDRMPISAVLAVGGPNDQLAPALIAGASGAVDKNTALHMGPTIVHALAKGELFLDRRAAVSLLKALHEHPRRSSIPSRQLELVDRLTSVESIIDLGAGDALEDAATQRQLFSLLVSLRGVRVLGAPSG